MYKRQELCIPLGYGRRMYLKLLKNGKDAIISQDIPQNQYTKWFDYGKMSKSLKVRTRQTGDYFTFNEALAKKSVQDYMVEEKIPRQKRDTIPLLAEESQILWIVGYRIGSYYKVGAETQYILQVRFRGEQ